MGQLRNIAAGIDTCHIGLAALGRILEETLIASLGDMYPP